MALTRPDFSQIEGLRNAVHVSTYGAVGDGATNDTAALQAAATAAGESGVVLLGAGKTYLFDGLTLTNAVTFKSDGWGDVIPAASGFLPSGAPRLLFNDSAAAREMLWWKSSTASQPIIGGGVVGVVLDGNNVATYGVRQSSVTNAIVSAFVMRCTNTHVLADDTNGVLSAHNFYPFLRVLIGGSALTQGAHGVHVKGDYSVNPGVTSLHFGSVVIEYENGNAFTFEDTDSCSVDYLKNVSRTSGATGYGVWFKLGDGAFPCQKNVIKHLARGGRVVADEGTIANVIEFANSEGLSIDSTGNTGCLYVKIGDFHDGDFHESHVYRLVDRKFYTPEMLQLLSGGARATYGTVGWGSITLADAVDTVLGLTCREFDWNDGSVIGVRLLLAVPASAASPNNVIRFKLDARSVATDVASNASSVQRTITASVNADYGNDTIQQADILFGTGNNIPYLKENPLLVKLSRLAGTDAADTYAGTVHIVGVSVLFTGGSLYGGLTIEIPKLYEA